MPANVSGDNSLNFVATLSTTEFKKSIDQLKIQLESVQASANRTKDPLRLSEYNQKAVQLKEEIGRMARAGTSGFDELGRAIDKPVGKLERLRYAAKLYRDAAASATNPELIEKYNRKLQQTEGAIQRTSNVGKKGFDEFGNKIKESGNMVSRVFSSVSKLAYILPGIGIAGLFSLALDPLFEFIKGLDIFKKKMTESVRASQNLSETFAGAEYANAVKTVKELGLNVDLAKKGLVDKSDVVRQYNETLGKTAGAVKTLNEVEAALTRNGQAYIDMTLLKAAANLSLEKAAEAALKQEQERVKELSETATVSDKILAVAKNLGQVVGGGSNTFSTDLAIAGQKRKDATIKQLNKEQKENERIAADFQKKAAEIARKFKFDLYPEDDPKKKGRKGPDPAKERERLLARMEAIDEEYRRKSKTKEEEELQAITDKFDKIRQEVIRFNAKHPTLAINLAPLNDAEVLAKADARYRHETEKLKTSLADQKALFQEYENYRNNLGEEKARERFGKELDLNKTYLERIQDEMEKIASVPVANRTGGQTERFKLLQGLRDAEVKENQKAYAKLTAELQDYEQQRSLITERYQREREVLLQQGNQRAINELDRFYQEDLNNLDDANAEKLREFQNLFAGVEELSIAQGREVVVLAEKKLEELVSQGRISEEFAKEIRALLKTTTVNLNERLPKRLAEMAGALQAMGQAVSGLDADFAKVLDTTGAVIGNIVNIKGSLDSIKEAQELGGIEGILGSATGALGAATAAVGIITTVYNAFDKSEERARKREEQRQYSEELRIKAINAQTEAMARQLELIQSLYGTERLTRYAESLDDITERYKELSEALSGKYILTGDKELDDIISKLNNGIQLTFLEELKLDMRDMAGLVLPTLDGIISKLGEVGTNSQSIEELQRLLDEGKLDETTAQSVEQLIRLGEQYRETFNAIREELTGTSIDGLVEELAGLFEKGLTPAAQEFGDNFEAIMKKAILNSFKRQFLEKQMQGFYEAFAVASESGGQLSETEIIELRKMYQDILDKAGAGFKSLQDIAAMDFGPDAGEDSQRGLAGAIKGITADQADLLAGQFGGLRLTAEKQWLELTTIKSTGIEHLNIATASLRQLEQIEVNTRLTERRLGETNIKLTEAISYLSSIDNTAREQNAGLRANGYS